MARRAMVPDGGSPSFFVSAWLPLSVSVLLLLSFLLLLLRSLTMVELLSLAVLLVTKQNDSGAASNGGGRETKERDKLLFFSPVLLFFCSFLLFSCQFKSSPLCSSLKQSPASFSLFGSFLQVRFPKFLPPLVFFFSFPPPFVFSLLCIYSRRKRGAPYHCHGAR